MSTHWCFAYRGDSAVGLHDEIATDAVVGGLHEEHRHGAGGGRAQTREVAVGEGGQQALPVRVLRERQNASALTRSLRAHHVLHVEQNLQVRRRKRLNNTNSY